MIRKYSLLLIAILFFVTSCKGKENELNLSAKSPAKSVIYYFHSNVRCTSCLKIEKYTKEVFEENFKDKLELRIVDVQKSENKHFITDYELYAKSVVIVKIKDGKEVSYKNLDKIWNYLRDENKFKIYVKNEIDTFLMDQGE